MKKYVILTLVGIFCLLINGLFGQHLTPFASNLKETRRWKLNDPSHGSYDEFKLKIFPNPAKGYFVVEYRAAKEANKNGSLSVTLTTIAGKEVMNLSAGRNYDQIAVPTNNLPSGSYIVSLKWNGSTKDHVKLIISK